MVQVPCEVMERHSSICAYLERRINADVGLEEGLGALATFIAEAAAGQNDSPYHAMYMGLQKACQAAADLPLRGPIEPCQVGAG